MIQQSYNHDAAAGREIQETEPKIACGITIRMNGLSKISLGPVSGASCVIELAL